ncbi:hypothetical protein AAVH_28584 [Aphelenchoides avenae]|nr:hypothetical protein AAVH_28584 [Aphelenchus avenae]
MTVGQGLVYQSRVALVTYAANATVVAPLTQYDSTNALIHDLGRIKNTSETEVNLLAALKAAVEVAYQVPQTALRQTVIVVAASAYKNKATNDDPQPLARQIKESGMKLMTVAMVRNDESPDEVESIKELASDGYFFHSDADKQTVSSDLIADIQAALCRANCFCPNGWFQFADSFDEPKKYFAECVRFSSSPANWYGAKASCAMQAGGRAFLASELTKLKHDFHADYVRSIKGRVVPYLIGLTYNDTVNRYEWDQTYSNGTHYSLRPNDYQPWFEGDGTDNLRTAVQVAAGGSDTYWYKVEKTSSQYMCQVDACDTDHYCDDGNGVVTPRDFTTTNSLRTTSTKRLATTTTTSTTPSDTPSTPNMETANTTSARAEPPTTTRQRSTCRNSSTAVPLYRAWKEGDRGDHFYTTNFDEWQNAIKNLGYKDEGITGRIFAHVSIGTAPLYRLYHRDVVDHFYTTSASEYDTAINRLGFKDEGVAGYVYPTHPADCPEVAPLYRMYKPTIFDHFYTTSAAERDNAAKQFGYTDEGIAAWIYLA